jgi:hypothetical protein
MLNNLAVCSGTDTMNGIWEFTAQLYGGDLNG